MTADRPALAVRALAAALLAAAIAASVPGEASALTATKSKEAIADHRFEVRCGEPDTARWRLPERANDPELRQPEVGQVVRDGFERHELARITAIDETVEAGRTVFAITATGSGRTCDLHVGQQTEYLLFRAAYEVRRERRVFVSDEQGGLRPRQRPGRLTASARAGWKQLRWRSWGGRSAVATGTFFGVRSVAVGDGDAGQRTFRYPVTVTLSRVRVCGDGGLYYTRLATRFRSRAPREIRKQARPPGTASCLD